MNRIYIDNAATTPVRNEVLKTMFPYFGELYGNPSSLYQTAAASKKAVEKAREQVANALGAKMDEIYFTGGGTESDNWALIGAAEAYGQKGGHIITSAIEHHAVLHTCMYLESKGYDATYLPVDEEGIVSVAALEEAIRPDTFLISIMFANNEIGTIQPVRKIGRLAKERKILFHTDAVQAVGHVPIDVNELNIDLLSLSAHKIYGPKGVGALYIRKGVKLKSFVHGGAQERSRRAGTENVPGIVGLGQAIELISAEMEEENKRLAFLRERLIASMRKDELFDAAKEFQVSYELILYVHDNGNLPVVNFAAGGIATPADAALMMQLGAEGVFVGSGIFKSGNPEKRAAAIIKAVTNYNDAKLLAELSEDLGEAMVGINEQEIELLMAERGK